MFEIQCGKKQQDDRVCMGHFWICASFQSALCEMHIHLHKQCSLLICTKYMVHAVSESICKDRSHAYCVKTDHMHIV